MKIINIYNFNSQRFGPYKKFYKKLGIKIITIDNLKNLIPISEGFLQELDICELKYHK